jgi:hypothetical protein
MIFEITVTAGVLSLATLMATLSSSLKTGLTKRPYESRLQPMTNQEVNRELAQTFGNREAAGDPEEAETTPYTSRAQLTSMLDDALQGFDDTDLDLDVVVQDEFV